MTIEDKAKAYDEAIERAKYYQKENGSAVISSIFPELKESEDERIRKGIKSILEHYKESGEVVCPYPFVSIDEALVWLEKQGEQKPIIEMKSPEESLNINSKTYNKIVNDCIFGENKPNFKVGDWIISKYMHLVMQILNNDNGSYKTVETDGTERNDSYNFIERNFKLWTIEDAKDGDVLSDGTTIFIFKDLLSDDSVMSYCDYETDSGGSDAFCPLSMNLMCSKITPATKEQRDILFEKMKEAGYEWDTENKQLKKISQRMISAEAKEAMYSKPTDLEEFINELSKQFPDVSFAKLSRIAVRVAKWAKPTDEEMKELLRTEYEKGRADAIAERQKSSTIDIDKMVSDYSNNKERGNEEFGKPVPCMVRAYRQGLNDAIGKVLSKPNWSEEDEERLKSCLNILQAKGLMGVTDTINSNWLKSIKERVQPQPKQEWSEEDDKNLDALITSLNNEHFAGRLETLKGIGVDKIIDWINSLKKRMKK